MQNGLIHDIDQYISWLNARGLFVSVHGKMISDLIQHNLHENPYCLFIKTNDEAWDHCIKCQQKVFDACNHDCLFGMCWAGVEEYVFYVDAKTFVSVSGYGIHRETAAERINRLSHGFYFDKSKLLTVYDQGLKHEKEDAEEIKTLIKPLCHMLSLLQLTLGDVSHTESKSKTFDSILRFVQRNLMQELSLRSIADACACSESTVSHLFKEHTGQSVKKYIQALRMEQAEKLLRTSDLPIGQIALLCGFGNTNYFTTAFKKQIGENPTQYRNQIHRP